MCVSASRQLPSVRASDNAEPNHRALHSTSGLLTSVFNVTCNLLLECNGGQCCMYD